MTTNNDMPTNKIHEGRNVKRFREMLGVKQEALAAELGEDWTQKKISLLETKETIDVPLLKQISAALKIPVEAFQNFDEDQAVNFISNTFNDQSNGYNYYPIFNINPVEKWLEAMEENKKLYERMIQEQKDTIVTLQALLENIKK